MSRHIDADELIEFFDGYPDHIEFDVEDIKSIINEQDTADVRENVRGEWQVVGYDKKYIPIVYTCSVCGFRTTMELEFDFCPNCGAEMRGDKP